MDDIDKFENKLETILDTINAFNFDVLCFLIEKLTLYKTKFNGKWLNILHTFHYNQRYYFNKIWTNENELNNQLIRTKDEYVINLLFDKFLHINEFDFADCSVVCYLLTILCCTDNFKLIKYHMEKLFHNTNDAERYNYNRNIIYFLFINSMDVYDTIYGVYNINCRYLNANIILFDYFNKYNILVGGKLNQYNNNYKQLLELMIIDEEIDFSIIKNVESSHMNMKIKDNNYINWISGLIITNRKSFNNFEYVLQLVNDNYTINRDFRGCYQFYLMLFNICDGAECRDSYKVKLQLIRFMIDLINNKYINANYHNFRLLYEICRRSSAQIRNEFSNTIINNYEEIIKLNSNKIGNSKINVILNSGNGIDFDFVQTMLRHLFYGQIINHHIKNPMDFGVGLPVIDNDHRYFSYNYPNYVKEAIFTLIAIYKIEKEEKNIVGNDLSQSLSYLPNELFEEICKVVEYNYLLYLLV